MTLLSVTNEAQDSLSLPRSTVVESSTDTNVRTLLAAAQQEGRQLARRSPWEAIVTEKTFTSIAQASQTNSIPSDFDSFINESMFNRSQTRGVAGPLDIKEWQSQQAISTSLLTDAFRIQGGVILLTPTPDAGDTYAYEYVSKNWCQSASSTAQSSWAADLDTGILSEDLMLLGIIWRFRKARGFDYAEEFNEYEQQVTQAIMRDGGKRTLSYGDDSSLSSLHNNGPLITEGSWNL